MKVKFVPQNVEFEIKAGQSVMHLAEDHGIYVKSVCRGVPSCAECRVRIVDGDNNVFPPAGEELSLIGSGWFIDRRRLACQLQCLGDVTVDMTEQLAKQSGQIGGRKSKIAKAIGDRVEDETVIRDSSASRDRDRDRGGDSTNDIGGYATNDAGGDEQADGSGGGASSGPAIRPQENRPRPQPQGSGGPRPIVPNPGGGSRPQPQGGGPRGGGKRRR